MKLFERLNENFITKKRENGEEFTCLKDNNHYEELRDVMMSVHGITDSLPNDFIYGTVADICSISLNYDRMDYDIISEISDGLTDIYNHDLLAWHKDFYWLVDEAQEEGLFNEDTNQIDRIRAAQYMLIERIGSKLLQLNKEYLV